MQEEEAKEVSLKFKFKGIKKKKGIRNLEN